MVRCQSLGLWSAVKKIHIVGFVYGFETNDYEKNDFDSKHLKVQVIFWFLRAKSNLQSPRGLQVSTALVYAANPKMATPRVAGDGQITVAEFLEGAIRLRGLAKSVDLAQAKPSIMVTVSICIPNWGSWRLLSQRTSLKYSIY